VAFEVERTDVFGGEVMVRDKLLQPAHHSSHQQSGARGSRPLVRPAWPCADRSPGRAGAPERHRGLDRRRRRGGCCHRMAWVIG
jgi:hypothetical protein